MKKDKFNEEMDKICEKVYSHMIIKNNFDISEIAKFEEEITALVKSYEKENGKNN